MFVVGAIILLHTLIPHEHYSKASDVVILHSHECSTNIFKDIQISFGVDHGSGHFEHFVNVTNDINFDAVEVESISLHQTESPVAYLPYSESTYTSLKRCCDYLRGPPAKA